MIPRSCVSKSASDGWKTLGVMCGKASQLEFRHCPIRFKSGYRALGQRFCPHLYGSKYINMMAVCGDQWDVGWETWNSLAFHIAVCPRWRQWKDVRWLILFPVNAFRFPWRWNRFCQVFLVHLFSCWSDSFWSISTCLGMREGLLPVAWALLLMILGLLLGVPKFLSQVANPTRLSSTNLALHAIFAVGDIASHVGFVMLIYWDIVNEGMRLAFALDPKNQRRRREDEHCCGADLYVGWGHFSHNLLDLSVRHGGTSRWRLQRCPVYPFQHICPGAICACVWCYTILSLW